MIELSAFAAGDLVWLSNPTESRTKLAPHWKGPYRILQVMDSGGVSAMTYRIISALDPSDREQVVHCDRLKGYTLPLAPQTISGPQLSAPSSPGHPVSPPPLGPELTSFEGLVTGSLGESDDSGLVRSRRGRVVQVPAHLSDFVMY